MPHEPSQPENWLRSELRNLPLPEGMIARLKELARSPDAALDAALCDIALPDELTSSLKDYARDPVVDLPLRDVTVPADLMASLRGIARLSDETIDARLCDVAVPSGLLDRLSQIPRRERAPRRWSHPAGMPLMIAASLLIALTAVFWGSMQGLINIAQIGTGISISPPIIPPDPPSPPADEGALAIAFSDGLPIESADRLQFDMLDLSDPDASRFNQIGQAFGENAGGADPLQTIFNQNFFATEVADAMPEAASIAPPTPRGVEPPRVAGFDWLSFLKTGVHPFVNLDAAQSIRQIDVPLVTSTTSYDMARRTLRQGKLPEPGTVRTEEFLAGMNYSFAPAVEGSLALRTAAGPSPFGAPASAGPGTAQQLVQVGLLAGPVAHSIRPPTHLTLAIDISASMEHHGRLQAIRDGLARFLSRLAPDDRFSLVTFSETAEVIIDDASASDAPRLLSRIRSLRSRQSTNLGAGLQVALGHAQQIDWAPPALRRVVLVTDSPGELPAAQFEQFDALAIEAAGAGVRLSVIDMSRDRADVRLAQMARLGGGASRHASTSQEFNVALAELASGESQLVAREARLTIRFNPQAVARYRLLGHEANQAGGLVGGPLELNLNAGEAATALFEIELRGNAVDDVASAEATWIDPSSGERRTIGPQRISRLQFATSAAESPIALQRASLAAEAAELLRGSPFAPSTSAGWKRLRDQIAGLPTVAVSDSSIDELVQIIDLADRIRAGKPVGGK